MLPKAGSLPIKVFVTSGIHGVTVTGKHGIGVNAGAYHTGRRWSDPQNRALLPAYTTYSVGASYHWRLADGPGMTARINADNLTDARYWATGGTTLYAGLGRTVRASLTLDY